MHPCPPGSWPSGLFPESSFRKLSLGGHTVLLIPKSQDLLQAQGGHGDLGLLVITLRVMTPQNVRSTPNASSLPTPFWGLAARRAWGCPFLWCSLVPSSEGPSGSLISVFYPQAFTGKWWPPNCGLEKNAGGCLRVMSPRGQSSASVLSLRLPSREEALRELPAPLPRDAAVSLSLHMASQHPPRPCTSRGRSPWPRRGCRDWLALKGLGMRDGASAELCLGLLPL